jgi:hypothetical protein
MADSNLSTKNTSSYDTTYAFPLKYDKKSGTSMIFSEYEYKRPSATAEYKPVSTGANIILPVPKALAAGYGANWESASLGAIGNAMGAGMKSVVDNTDKNNIISSLSQQLKGAVQQRSLMQNSEKAAAYLVSDALDDNFKNVQSHLGVARNPFVSQLFTSVAFRSFTFEWSFFAKEYQESVMLTNIIRKFKAAMHPTYASFGEDAFFQYPSIFKIRFSENVADHLFDIGMCVLKQVNIDYHNQGAPVYFTYQGKKIPASINIQLEFSEIEINTRELITGDNKDKAHR